MFKVTAQSYLYLYLAKLFFFCPAPIFLFLSHFLSNLKNTVAGRELEMSSPNSTDGETENEGRTMRKNNDLL